MYNNTMSNHFNLTSSCLCTFLQTLKNYKYTHKHNIYVYTLSIPGCKQNVD